MNHQRRWPIVVVATALGVMALGCDRPNPDPNAAAPADIAEPPPAVANSSAENGQLAAAKPSDAMGASDPTIDNPAGPSTDSPSKATEAGEAVAMTPLPPADENRSPDASLPPADGNRLPDASLPPADENRRPAASLPPAVNMATPPLTTPIPDAGTPAPTKLPSEK